MNDRACPRDGVRPVGHVGSRPQGEVPRAGWAYLESLEARLLLSGTAAQQAMELFSVSAALFVENQGQWADPSVRYVHHGNGVNVAMTDAGPVFQLFRDDPANPQNPSDPPSRRAGIDPQAMVSPPGRDGTRCWAWGQNGAPGHSRGWLSSPA